ncbi:acyl-coenzyme A thioesterase 1-like [Pelobates cultripes]|uniref:Acyl-coenzyme A thioesterase 1-like n=1 Tax=Pelobates cultripes TaxID=61616 RepID=A0AAD1TNP7_PELCU|nr:acyl-coenzyme A thioesterase 1-like [Pelobates cultripes]
MQALLSLQRPAIPRVLSCRSMAVSLQVSPGRCVYDEPLAVRAEGLEPGQAVTLHTQLTDEGGETFSSRGRYRAGSRGELDLTQSPALEGGSYTGLEPEGPLWALEPRTPHRRFLRKDVQSPQRVDFSLYRDHEPLGKLLATATQDRTFMGEGVSRHPVREGRVRGSLFLPPGVGPFPGIIEIQGTGGGLLEYKASLLANKGFATLALAYYNYEDLPKEMNVFNLEYFEEAVNYMLQHPKVKGPGIGLMGHSKGGDLVASMASFLKGITAAVLVNGSIANVGAALKYKDVLLPPIGIDVKKMIYPEKGVADITNILVNPLEEGNRKSLIPIWKADCKFLFVVGQDDRNWRSEFYAQTACSLLVEARKEKPEIVLYPETGHYIEAPNFPLCKISMHKLVGLPVVWGGQTRQHAMAQVDSWKKIQIFFNKHLNQKNAMGNKL